MAIGAGLKLSLLGGICGSLIRSNCGGSPVRSGREPVRASGFSPSLFVPSCLFEPVAPSYKGSVRQGRSRQLSATGVMRQLTRGGSGARASSTMRAPIG